MGIKLYSFYPDSNNCNQEICDASSVKLQLWESIHLRHVTFRKPVTLTDDLNLIVCNHGITWALTSECIGTTS